MSMLHSEQRVLLRNSIDVLITNLRSLERRLHQPMNTDSAALALDDVTESYDKMCDAFDEQMCAADGREGNDPDQKEM